MQPITDLWLARCCEQLHAYGIDAAALYLDGAGAATSVWPDPDDESIGVEAHVAPASAAFAARRTIVRPHAKDEAGDVPPGRLIAIPIELGGRRLAVVTLATHRSQPSDSDEIALIVRAAGAWLAVLLSEGAQSDAGATSLLARLVSTVLEPEDARSAYLALVSELATKLACERVSLGFLDSTAVRLESVSHSARFDRRTRLGRAIVEAMEEAIDAESCVVWPGDSEKVPQRAHEKLCTQHEMGCALSVPLSAGGVAIGALTAEYRTRQPGASIVAARLGQIATLLGPLLELRRADARSLPRKIVDGMRESARSWLGEERRPTLLALGGLATLILLLAIIPGTQWISAPARLEGLVQRAIVAPIDGYVAESRARAGDVIEKGSVLGALDDTDLLLEQRKWSARVDQLQKEYRGALALRDRSEARIASARLAQARAELDLVEGQLKRTRLIAPFDGVVAEGDLSRELGSPIERGQVLFQVAPLDRYRIVLEVGEREIDEVRLGQKGRLVLAARPNQEMGLVVERIVPIAASRDGRTFFRVEGVLEEKHPTLRPGMEGVGKIEAGRRSLLWIYTHELVDWLRLNLWAYVP